MQLPAVVQPQPAAMVPQAPPAPQLPTLDTLKRLFLESSQITQPERVMARKHRRYYDGRIEEKLRQQLKRKRQPDFVINRVRPGVEGMVGVVDRGKSDPRAYPRNDQDEAAAEVATDCLRYVSDANRWPRNKLEAFRNICIEGTAAVIVEVDGRLEVPIRRIRYEEFFHDPYSREKDFSDASYMGVGKWQYVDEVISLYPEKTEQLRSVVQRGDIGDSTWADRPYGNSTLWTDPQRKRLLVIEMYKRHAGTWVRCVFVGDLILEEGVSPYLDNDGQPCNPIEAQSAYVDDQNHRYGPVADMIGPQDEINVYRRKAAHLATFRQVQETDPVSAYADPEEVRREASKPDGVLPPGYQIVPNDKFQMDMALLAEAKAEIERTQVNPAILGRQDADASGRASLIRQQAGLTELAHLFSGLEDLEHRIFKQVWARVRQFWTVPKMIRVTDDEGSPKFIQINEPVWGPPAPILNADTGQVELRPQYLGMRNTVAEVDVDIIIDSTPDTANVQQEQFNMLVELARVGALGQNPGPFLLKASSLPRKRELLDELQRQQEAPPPPQVMQAQQIDMAGKAASVDLTKARAAEANARAAKAARDAAMPPDAPQGQAMPQPKTPIEQATDLVALRKEQANTEKLFAQADEARARAQHLGVDALQRLLNTGPDLDGDGTR